MIPSSPLCHLLVVLAVTAGYYYHPASSFLPPTRRAPSSLTSIRRSPTDMPGRPWDGPPQLFEAKVDDDNDDDDDDAIIGTVALLVPSSPTATSKFGAKSPISPPSYLEVAEQLVRKISHFSDGRIVARVVHPPPPSSSSSSSSSGVGGDGDAFCVASDALFAIGLSHPSDVRYMSQKFRERRGSSFSSSSAGRRGGAMCQFAVDCGSNVYAPVVGPYDGANTPPLVAAIAPWSDVASGARLASQMSALFDGTSTDEFALATMLYFDRFSGRRVPWVMHSIDVTWEKGPLRNAGEVCGMITKCGPCIARCLADENCASCIKALDAIDTRDQVSSYRTVVSYESDLLRDFSLCILTKNNVFGCAATVPKLPAVTPIGSWRGGEVTTDIARAIMIGHLRGATGESFSPPDGSRQLDVSWKVACGANAAYDQFPSQNQLFYPTAKGKDLWYDPVFRVETIDGRNVWCKRHYRVRNGHVPGTFRFSVLDNGVTSEEFWTIVGAADDLSWVVFHYAGAAAAVGQRYIGGLLCTPDGRLPPSKDLDDIWRIFRSAEIEPWELFVVDNDEMSSGALSAGPPPLDYYRKTAAVVG